MSGYLIWLAIPFPAISVPAFMLRYGIGAEMLTVIALGAGVRRTGCASYFDLKNPRLC